jgi:phytoene dehydrogenase-like protein
VRTLERLLPDEPSLTAQLERARSLRTSLPCFLLHMGVSGVSTESLAAAHGYHWSSWDGEDVATHAFKVFVPTLYEPAMAPPGGHVVIVQKLTTTGADKNAVAHAILPAAERIIPGFGRAIVTHQSASAMTSRALHAQPARRDARVGDVAGSARRRQAGRRRTGTRTLFRRPLGRARRR